jgi:hypothetical protein
VAFCQSFSSATANPANSRAGQLDGVLWGTSMESGSQPGDGIATVPSACGTGYVNYPANVQVCNGGAVTTVNDAGTVTSLAMYPKQPFDFAGRTGTIAFDVSNNTQGSHAAWPELWVTDQPVPDPFVHESTWQSQPRNGFGIRFAGCTDSSGNGNTCTLGNSGVGVDSAVVVNNYVVNDSFNGGSLKVYGYGSVLKSGSGQLNHYQLDVSTSEIDVYGTNPFTGTWNPAAEPLTLLAKIPVNLTFTRGLVWLEDVHYNGDKFNTQRVNNFTWNDLGFDGPVLPRDLAFDAADNNNPDGNIAANAVTGIDAAWNVNPSLSLQVPGVTGISDASGALLTFNFYSQSVIPLNVSVNGNNVSIPWPYPDQLTYSPRTIAIPVPLSDVVTGTNTVTFNSGGALEQVANVDLILQGAGGVVDP